MQYSGEFLPTLFDADELTRRQMLQTVGALAATTLLASCGSGSGEGSRDDEAIVPHVAMELAEVQGRAELLYQADWRYLAGAAVNGPRLDLTPTRLAIINKRDGNRIEPNPPMMLYGGRLQTEGDFAVGMTVEQGAQVTFQLFGRPPIRFDDFRYMQPGIECSVLRSELVVRSWDGQSQEPAVQRFVFANDSDARDIVIQRRGDGLVFIAKGTEVGRIANGRAFDSGEVWLGLSSEAGPAAVSQIAAYPGERHRLWLADTTSLEVTERSPDGLQTLVRKPDFRIGSAAALGPLVSDDRYAQLYLGGEFGGLTTENALKPQDAQPTEGLFTFGEADAIVDMAQRHGLAVHGHTTVYDKATPAWMSQLPYGTAAEKRRVQDVLENHVYTLVSHFRGHIASWDVVNEAIGGFNKDVRLVDNIWYKALGERYLDIAFHAARQADPGAKLFLNEWGLETNFHPDAKSPDRGKFSIALAHQLLDRGVPLDGIGIEGHVYKLPQDRIEAEKLGKLMEEYDRLGLLVRVSELDVTGANGPEEQARQYADVLRVCLAAPNCTGLTTWGATDAYGSTSSVRNGRLRNGDALPYTADYRPKPARQAMLEVLRAA